MNPYFGWILALAGLVGGYAVGGLQGLVMALTIVAFWLVLQFSQAMRVMRGAAQAPVGHVPSAVMLNAKLHAGMRILDVVALTRSLGRKLSDTPEVFVWHDDDGGRVEARFERGRLCSWQLVREGPPTA